MAPDAETVNVIQSETWYAGEGIALPTEPRHGTPREQLLQAIGQHKRRTEILENAIFQTDDPAGARRVLAVFSLLREHWHQRPKFCEREIESLGIVLPDLPSETSVGAGADGEIEF